jgi:hypothetical protein
MSMEFPDGPYRRLSTPWAGARGEEVWPLKYSIPLTMGAAAALWAIFIGLIVLIW